MLEKKNLVVILGPTAVGKTRFAAELSAVFDGEIISADSRQVYKKMNIGTGKDYDDYIVNNKKVNYHLIDIVNPNEEFNLFRFVKSFITVYNQIISRKKTPFLAGGTGLNIDAILKEYALTETDFNTKEIEKLNQMENDELKDFLLKLKPKQHNITDLSNRQRIINSIMIEQSEDEIISTKKLHLNPIIIGINPGRDEIKKRITKRLKERLKKGMIEEVEKLFDEGITYDKLEFFGLEYKFIALYLQQKLNYNDMFQKLNSAIAQFAKRQMTWYRKMEREGAMINWFKFGDVELAKKLLLENGFCKKVS